MQIRAGVTRQRILVAATELFEDVGYGNTSLSDIVAHSHLSKGAFYYHFQSKESVAAALIKEADAALAARFYGTMNAPSPTLENLIAATFGAMVIVSPRPHRIPTAPSPRPDQPLRGPCLRTATC